MNKLSIIVPVYNVEQYLHKCVDSLLAQGYNDYEIILVDDGSTDSCPTICDEYSTLYTVHHTPTIKVVHRKNGGLSAARNTGIAVAKGEYVCFVDSDDYWEPNVLSGLMGQIERDKLDVLRFKYQNVNEQYEVFNPYKRDSRLDNDYSESVTDGVSFLNLRMSTQCYAVMFIVKRDMLDGCLFTDGIYFEDTDWTPRMLSMAKRVASTNTMVYNYLVRIGSISRAVSREKQKKLLDDKMRLLREMQRQAEALRQSGRYDKWYHNMIADTVISIIEILSKQLYEERKEYLKQLDGMNIYPIIARSVKARLINISPSFVVKLLHFKNS